MKALPQNSDFKLDFKKFPKRKFGGIADIDAVKRLNYRDAMFKKAKDEWIEEAQISIFAGDYLIKKQKEQIKELKKLLEQVVINDKNNQLGSNGWEFLLGQISIKLKQLTDD